MEEPRRVANAVLDAEALDAEVRDRIQDVLWDGQGPVILERTRRTLAAALDIDDLVVDTSGSRQRSSTGGGSSGQDDENSA